MSRTMEMAMYMLMVYGSATLPLITTRWLDVGLEVYCELCIMKHCGWDVQHGRI